MKQAAYIRTATAFRPRFSAGRVRRSDVADDVSAAVTAAGLGCMAALEAENFCGRTVSRAARGG